MLKHFEQNFRPAVWPVPAHPIDKPLRMRVKTFILLQHRTHYRFALALETSQGCIDQSCRTRLVQLPAGINGR
jgi:hypothetical protein